MIEFSRKGAKGAKAQRHKGAKGQRHRGAKGQRGKYLRHRGTQQTFDKIELSQGSG